MENDDLLAELAEVRRQYTARIPERLVELAAAIEAAIDPALADAARLAHAHLLAHRFAGSAGSYGHAELGAALGPVARALAAALEDPAQRREKLADARARVAAIEAR